jgi:hypothetical protein
MMGSMNTAAGRTVAVGSLGLVARSASDVQITEADLARWLTARVTYNYNDLSLTFILTP